MVVVYPTTTGWPNKPTPMIRQMVRAIPATKAPTPVNIPSTKLKPLLKKLSPQPGTLITADAMHCQQANGQFITQELGGDYLFGLKGNQSGILEKAEHLLAQQGFPPSGPVGKGARTA